MSVQHMADAIGIPVYEIMGIEQGNVDRYAGYLSKTLKEIFLESTVQKRDGVDPTHGTPNTDPLELQSRFEEHESIVFEHMQEIVSRIIACGEKTSMTTIKRYMCQMHIPSQLLKQYSSVNAMVKQLMLDAQKERQNERGRRIQRREEDLVERVQTAIAQLRSSGQHVYQEAISRAVGLPTYTLKNYSRVNSILQPLRQECRIRRKKTTTMMEIRSSLIKTRNSKVAGSETFAKQMSLCHLQTYIHMFPGELLSVSLYC